jgi:hypothetical protein
LSENVIDSPVLPAPAVALSRSHGTFTLAVHGQLAGVLIVVFTVVPGMHGVKSTGATAYVQMPISPLCLTVSVRSATVMVPLRPSTSVWRATEYETAAVPDPVGVATVNHEALLRAVHAHPSGALTVNVPSPPSLLKSAVDGATSYVQACADRPCCVTWMRSAPTLIAPVLASDDGLAVTVYAIVPGPLPEPLPIVIHESVVVAVHAHPCGAVTEIDPDPPSLSSVTPVGANVRVHVGPVGDFVPQPKVKAPITSPSATRTPPDKCLVMSHLCRLHEQVIGQSHATGSRCRRCNRDVVNPSCAH